MLTTASLEQLKEYGATSTAQQQAKLDAYMGQQQELYNSWLGQQQALYGSTFSPTPVTLGPTVNGAATLLDTSGMPVGDINPLVMLNGYGGGLQFSLPVGFEPYSPAPYKASVTTTMPQGAVVPQSPQSQPVPPAPAYIVAKLASHGWDTHARSLAPLQSGKYFDFTIGEGAVGACISVGPAGADGKGIHQFSHCLIIDGAGVRVYEGGRFKRDIRGSYSAVSNLRIYRQIDNSIVYVVTTGTETLVYTSLDYSPVPSAFDLFVYGYLYASGDKVTSASFQTGTVQYGSV